MCAYLETCFLTITWNISCMEFSVNKKIRDTNVIFLTVGSLTEKILDLFFHVFGSIILKLGIEVDYVHKKDRQ